MPSEPPALTPEEAFEADRVASERFAVPSALLMENAGRAAADEAERLAADAARDAGIVVGKGRNGGDGLVVARTLHNRGWSVRIYSPFELRPEPGDVADNLDRVRRLGLQVEERRMPGAHDLLVDALFGIGLARDVQGEALECVRAVNRLRDEASARVLAVDVPSGLDARTGRPRGEAVRAHVTVAMGFPKTGFLVESARRYTGRIVVAEIGYPRGLLLRPRGSLE